MNVLTPAGARQARELAEQRFALAFDAKTDAAARLARAHQAADPGDVIAAARTDVVRTKRLYADARAALDQAIRAERDVLARRRVTWREPCP